MTPPTYPLKQATIRHASDGVPWYPIKPGAYASMTQVLTTQGLRAILALHPKGKLTAWRKRDQASVTLALTLHSVTIRPPTADALTHLSPEEAADLLTDLSGVLPPELRGSLNVLTEDLRHFTARLDEPAFTGYLTSLSALALYVRLRVDHLTFTTTNWDAHPHLLRGELALYLDPAGQAARREQVIRTQLNAIHATGRTEP